VILFENEVYRVALAQHGRRVNVGALLSLSLLSQLDTTDGADETLAILEPEVGDGTIVVERRSTLWNRAWLELRCLDSALEVHTCVRGSGALTDVRLLGGRSVIPRAPLGRVLSGTAARTLFSPNPEDGVLPFRAPAEGAVTGVVGEGEPGRGRWLFTPAPLYFALGDGEEWLDLGVAAPVDELRFAEVAWQAVANGFSLALDYEGWTEVDGEFRAPVLIVTAGVADPYAGLRRHRDDLTARGFAPPPRERTQPAWWREPIFCGWGAQCHLAGLSGGAAADFATQEHYDGFLAQLEEHDVRPGTIVIDDKWQATYGRNEPDTAKWPDLRGWIAARHARGQHVLLWWKAWDPEGLHVELCVRNRDGVPVAVDPNNDSARDALAATITELLSPAGFDADGLKVDFTGRTPSGRSLEHADGAWGIAFLHELLAVVYRAAKAAKPDALVITHTPHPSFADVTDMIRLNDVVGGQELVPQMQFRAEVVRAACPELLIDTDDWRVPDKQSWRAFLDVKAAMGVPSLYYASHLDATGEELDDDDYAAVRRAWAAAGSA
jgi:hypothetical protein